MDSKLRPLQAHHSQYGLLSRHYATTFYFYPHQREQIKRLLDSKGQIAGDFVVISADTRTFIGLDVKLRLKNEIFSPEMPCVYTDGTENWTLCQEGVRNLFYTVPRTIFAMVNRQFDLTGE